MEDRDSHLNLDTPSIGLPTAENRPAIRRERMVADALLLVVAIIWGSAFVAQRIAALEVGVFIFNGLRFLIGALVVFPFAWNSVRRGEVDRFRQVSLKSVVGVILAGTVLACGAAFQQAGLHDTTAGNAGFITGLYVVIIPLFLALFWRRIPRSAVWIAALMASLGLFMLSTGGRLELRGGDALVLISAIFWALHVLVIDWMVKRMNVLTFAVGQYLVCGLLSLGVGLAIEPVSLASLLDNSWVILYTGMLSVGLGYTLQAFGQRRAPPADAAIILSMEAVFAALAGWIFLKETLTVIQILGCGVILAGMLVAQSETIFGKKAV